MTSHPAAGSSLVAPAGTSTPPKAKFLVVCGILKKDDDRLFGDLIGFYHVLKKFGFDGEFWSSFPLEDYFGDGNPNIRFGRSNRQDWKPLPIYTKKDFDHNVRFWKQYHPHKHISMVPDVIDYIDKTSQQLVDGDVFTLVLIGHGDSRGTALGTQTMGSEQITNAFEHFRSGVQVNLVVKSFESNLFAEKLAFKNQRMRYVHTSASNTEVSDFKSPNGRYQNSQFSGAFLRGLRLALTPEATRWTLGGHVSYVSRKTSHNTSHYTDMELITKFTDVLFTEYVDRNWQGRNARRILTPPARSTQPAPARALTGPSQGVIDEAEARIGLEVSLIGGNMTEMDNGLSSAHTYSKYCLEHGSMTQEQYRRRVGEQLEAFRWRFRIQEGFYLAMEGLANKDLIDPVLALSVPINWLSTPKETTSLVNILESFSLVSDSCYMFDTSLCRDFDAPFVWLAILIARTCTDLAETLSYLVTVGLLGAYDHDVFLSVAPEYIEVNPVQQRGKETGSDPSPPRIGFWLPQSMTSMDKFARNWWERYSGMQQAYEGFFGEGSWGDGSLITQSIAPWVFSK